MITAPPSNARAAAFLSAIARALSSTAWRRGTTLTAILLLLQLVVFRSFYSGESVPPYDFLGAYASEAFAWWEDGGFFAPEGWVPYVWAGYPSAVGLQNSGWYLPTGIITLFGPYTLHMAAILAALHVAFGSYGMYFLVRSFRAGFGVSLLAAVAIFFGVGFYSNASHIDIARSYAWLPWVLLICTPQWRWKRWWSIPLAGFLLWQALTGIYPGMIPAAAYVLVPWIVAQVAIHRPRFTAFLLPLAVSALSALLLSMPRLLPYLLLDDGGSTTGQGDLSLFSPSLFSTVLFGYGIEYDLPNDVTMRSFFVPVTVLVLALFARWSDPLAKAALTIGVPAFLLGMPFLPWFQAAQQLPGLGLSRFTMSDYKVFLIVAAVLLAASGLRSLLSVRRSEAAGRVLLPVGAGWLVLLGLGALALRIPQSKADTIPPLLLLAVVLGIVTAYAAYRLGLGHHPSRQSGLRSINSLLIITLGGLTAVSGVVWAYSTPGPWRVDRESVEIATFGSTVDSLIAERAEAQVPRERRPARAPFPEDPTDVMLLSQAGNAAFYSGQYSLPAYVNLKRSANHKALEDTLLDTEFRNEFAAYLALPGTVLKVSPDGSTTGQALLACVEQDRCGIEAIADGYSPGFYKYRMSLGEASVVNLNEAFYPGWAARACTTTGCTELDPEPSRYGTVQIALPAGVFDLELRYTTPGRTAGWALFGAGTVILLGAAVAVGLARKRQKVSDNGK